MKNKMSRAGMNPAPTGIALILIAFTFSGCAAGGVLLQVASVAAGGNQQLANAGKSMSRAGETEEFTPEQKYYTGRTVAADLLLSEKASSDTALEKYVGKVGQTLAMGCGMGDLPQGWHFILTEGAEPDAFACPGGIIFVSKGLVALCETEDELAGALAHEISHVALDHPIKAISAANSKAALSSLASFGLGAAAQSTGMKGGDLASLTNSFDMVVGEVGKAVSHGYDRDKEGEADKAAVHLLTETGYDPRGLKKVLLKLTKGDHSHGDPKARAAAVENEAYEAEPVPTTLAARTERFKAATK